MELLKKVILHLSKSFPHEKDYLNETWSMAREEAMDTSPTQACSLGLSELREKFGNAAVETAMRATVEIAMRA